MTNPGIFIVFEGIDGSGKSTLCNKVYEALKNERDTVQVCYPSKIGAIGKFIRDIFVGKHKVDIHAMAHLFVADGIDCEPHIVKYLLEGTFVLSDRHHLISQWAYQTEEWHIEALIPIMCSQVFTKPDLVIFVDTPIAVCLDRIQKRAEGKTLYEKEDPEYYKRLRDKYFSYLIQHENICISVKGELPIEQNVKEIIEAIDFITQEKRDGRK